MNNAARVRQQSYSGGWWPGELAGKNFLTPPHTCSIMENVGVMPSGLLARRGGIRQVDYFGAGGVRGIWESPGSNLFCITLAPGSASDLDVFRSNQYDLDSTSSHSWTNIGSAGPMASLGNFAYASGVEFRTSGVNGTVLYVSGGDGSTAGVALFRVGLGGGITTPTFGGAARAFTSLAVYNNRLFGLYYNSATGFTELHYSGLGDGDSLGVSGSGGGVVIIHPASIGQPVSLAAVSGGLLTLHAGGISVFTGWSQDDISIQTGTSLLDADTGSSEHYAHVHDGYAYFFGPDGACRTNGMGVDNISRNIFNLRGPVFRYGSPQRIASLDRDRVGFLTADTGHIAVFNATLGIWEGYWILNSAAGPLDLSVLVSTRDGFAVGTDSGSTIHVQRAFGSDLSPIYNYDNDALITARFQTNPLDGGEPFLEKSARWVQGLFGGADGGTDDLVVSSDIPVSGRINPSGIFRSAIGGRFYAIEIEVEDSSASYTQTPTYGPLEIDYFPLEERGQ